MSCFCSGSLFGGRNFCNHFKCPCGFNDVCCFKHHDAIDDICEGIDDIREGICNLCSGLEDIINHMSPVKYFEPKTAR